MQLRDPGGEDGGQWIEMGGGLSFDLIGSDGKTHKVNGTLDSVSEDGTKAYVKVTNNPDGLADGVYEVDADKVDKSNEIARLDVIPDPSGNVPTRENSQAKAVDLTKNPIEGRYGQYADRWAEYYKNLVDLASANPEAPVDYIGFQRLDTNTFVNEEILPSYALDSTAEVEKHLADSQKNLDYFLKHAGQTQIELNKETDPEKRAELERVIKYDAQGVEGHQKDVTAYTKRLEDLRSGKDLGLDPKLEAKIREYYAHNDVYRQGNLTVTVPHEYRSEIAKKNMQGYMDAAKLLNEKYPVDKPVDVTLLTWLPGQKTENTTYQGNEASGWATSSKYTPNGHHQVTLWGQEMLLDDKTREPFEDQLVTDKNNTGWSMFASYQVMGQLYTLAHEWGHVRDFDSEGDGPNWSGITAKLKKAFFLHPFQKRDGISQYGKTLPWETVAELFAQVFFEDNYPDIWKVEIDDAIKDIVR